LAPLVDSPRRGLGRSAFALIVLLFAFLTPSQIPSDFVNRGFTGELIRCAILVIIEIQSFRDPLQYPQRPGRFLFGKEVDLQFEVIASLQRLVNGALADQHAGSKENGLQGENRRQQGKRIFIEGLVRGIFDAMEALKAQQAKTEVAQLMATGYSIPATDALSMLGDAHSTNWAENREFFVNQNNPANFERTWNTAYFLYRRVGMVSNQVPFDQIMDFTVIKKLGAEPRYANQRNEYQVQFVPTTASTVQAESNEILTKTVVIHFYPNSSDLHKKVTAKVNGQDREDLYDPNVDFVVDEIGRLAGQYGAARIVIEGHTDASMKGQIDPAAVKDLSLNRANAVKEAVLRKFQGLQANQFLASGMGWDRPADPMDPMNSSKNRRVEVKVYPLEATH